MTIEPEIIKTIKKHGHKYRPALLPADIPRGKLGVCFDENAIVAVRSRGKYHYVEGIARMNHQGKKGRWILHAWLTDGQGRVAYDRTWRCVNDKTGQDEPVPADYIGLRISPKGLFVFMRATGMQGIIPNAWRAPALANEVLGITLVQNRLTQ